MNKKEKLIEILCVACESDRIIKEPALDLISSGLLDSLALIQLIDGIYEEFNTEISATEIPAKLWHNVTELCDYIVRML